LRPLVSRDEVHFLVGVVVDREVAITNFGFDGLHAPDVRNFLYLRQVQTISGVCDPCDEAAPDSPVELCTVVDRLPFCVNSAGEYLELTRIEDGGVRA
jgi:hypothetical protein